MDEEASFVSADQLPTDPLMMPPPYWRSSGAVFCLLDAMESLPILLADLVTVLERTNTQLEIHFKKYPNNEQTEEEMEEFSEITSDLVDLESEIKAKIQVAILMSSIESEDSINRFCVYNLKKDVSESIEKLSPPEKLLIAAGVLGEDIDKSHSIYGDLRILTKWRNAFAHGHCVDRPTKSLRHNHLLKPKQYPGIISHTSELRRLISSYIRVSDYLSSISRNQYGAGKSFEVERVREILTNVSQYQFIGNEYVYEVKVTTSQR